MTTQQIIPFTPTVNTSGQQSKPNGIVQTQSPQNTGAFVLCDNGTVYINGAVQFTPPQPIADSSKIFSSDLSSQIQCQNGGTIEVTGTINGYSTTAQTGQAINNATADFVTQTFLENNYYDTTETQIFVGNAIDELSTVYMPIDQTLDQIPLAENTVDLNQQKIENLADPSNAQDSVNLQYLQNNYTDTTQSELYVGNAISQLSNVYQSINTTLNDIPPPENEVDMNSFKIVNLLAGTQPTDAVNLSQLDGYIPVTGNINSLTAQTANYDSSGFQLTVSNAPSANNDLTNKLYVDGQISGLSTVYQNINTTLDAIPLAINNMNFNGQKLQNIGMNIDTTDAVRQDYLTTYYLTSGDSVNLFQQISEMVNYVQTSFLTSNYTNNTVLQSTYALISSLQNYVLSSTLVSELSNYASLDFLNSNFYTQTESDQLFATQSQISDFVTQTELTDNYYTRGQIDGNFALISSLSSYVLTSSLNTILSAYVTSAQLAIDLQSYATEAYVQAYTYSRSYIDSNFALISSLSSYVTNNGLVQILSDYVTNGFLTTNYTDNTVLQQLYATKQYVLDNLSLYVSSSSLATTLAGYLQIANIGQYTTAIQTNTSGTKSKVNCATNSEILFNIADVQKLKMYVPAGQSTQPLGLIADDKIQMISKENSFSLTGQKALQAKPTQNFSGLYISGLDDAALNVGQQIQIGSQFCQKLAIASGHTDIGGGTQVLYSTISNSAEGVAQQNLQISGGTPQTDNTIVLYSDTYATALGQNLTAQFTKKTGYSTTTAITEANQFSSKTYVDSAVSGLSSVYLTIANAASTYLTIANAASTYLTISNAASTYQTIANMSNYYTKAVTDATFATITSLGNYVTNSSLATTLSGYLTTSAAASTYLTIVNAASTYVLQTTPLNDLAAPTGDLAMEGFEIKGLSLIPSLESSAASKSYVDSQVAGGALTLATAKANFIALDGTQTASITAAIPMNGQKITGLGNATTGTDALNRQTADGRYFQASTTTLNQINAPTASLTLNNQQITNLGTPTLATDAATKAYVDTRAPFKTAIINVGSFRTVATPGAVSGVSGFVTSATKQITPQGAASNYVVINYPNAGYVPLLQVTVGSSTPTNSMQQNPTFSLVFSVSATQATILFGIYDLGGIGLFSSVTWSLNITAMSNTLT